MYFLWHTVMKSSVMFHLFKQIIKFFITKELVSNCVFVKTGFSTKRNIVFRVYD